MAMAVCLIFLAVMLGLTFNGSEESILSQKMTAADQAGMIAFNSAEAGLVAAEVKINGGSVDLSQLKGQIDYAITADMLDQCQQHIFKIIATASYQNAHATLQSAYLQARQPPLPGCAIRSIRLWWQ
jgi:hypothetical protein